MTPADFRAARKSIRLSQDQLAAELGVSTKTIGNVEAGKSDRPRLYGLALSALVAERIATSPAGGLE